MTNPTTAVFRVDASFHIGNGHAMRCLALAGVLSDRGIQCRFVCAPGDGNPAELIGRRGFVSSLISHSTSSDWRRDAAETAVVIGGTKADWLIVDHYGLDHRWESAVHPFCDKLMVIDDLADRSHSCDLLLDQNLGRTPDDYRGLVPPDTRLLTGPSFALIRPEFSRLRETSLAYRQEPQLRTIMVSMGGTDPTNATGRILNALAKWAGSPRCRVVAVLGPRSPWMADVEALAARMPYECSVLQDPSDYASQMAECDLCIGTAGTTSWERCCLGVPSIVASVADNQSVLADRLVEFGAAMARLDLDDLDHTLASMMNAATQPDALARASKIGAALCSGDGAERVAREILEWRA